MQLLKKFESIESELQEFFCAIKSEKGEGRYQPCISGTTPLGKQLSLGFSCFALRSFFILGWWDRLDQARRKNWINFIHSFYTASTSVTLPRGIFGYQYLGYIDPPLIDYLAGAPSRAWFLHPKREGRKIVENIRDGLRKRPIYAQRVALAETKQAISTLFEVDQISREPFDGFPLSEASTRQFLRSFDWNRPWEGGGQASACALLLATEGSRLLGARKVGKIQDILSNFFAQLADEESGGYFHGDPPRHQELINGSMKVLSALDWLHHPIHYPERLIDTTLSYLPNSNGCDLVDAIYVLYRCSQETQYRQRSIINYALEVAELIAGHRKTAGGFSYNKKFAQKIYYGAPISEGLQEPDIHGTFLFIWALSMIFKLCEYRPTGVEWKIIRP